MRKQIIFLFIIVLTACSSSETKDKTEITISAAASLTDSLIEVKNKFEEAHPDIKVTFNFGGSGALRKQIEQGAPIDVFISASKRDYDLLFENGQFDEGTSFLQNQLVMIVPSTSSLDSFEQFINGSGNIAIGTPEAVPAGTYAVSALQHLNVWDQLQERIVYTKDVRQVLTYVENGSVDVGIVYQSDTKNVDKIRILQEIDSNAHELIEYYIGIIKDENNNIEAKQLFYQFILSEEAEQIFVKHGFEK